MRTSLRQIADACGILPGSLYHHFESKEAIIVELIERYDADLDHVAERARAQLPPAPDTGVPDLVIDLATAIAACAMRHRAAVAMTLFDPPSGAAAPLLETLAHRPTTI